MTSDIDANGKQGVSTCSWKYRSIGLLLVFAGVFATYLQMFGLPYFISEYAEFYTWNLNMTPEKWIETYNPLHSGWYRPSAQILQYQIVSNLVGWHNIFAFQCVTMLTMLALAASVYFVAEKLTGNVCLAALAGLAGAIHPVMYMLSVDLVYFDAMYQIALLFALYFFVDSLERGKPKLAGWTSLLFLFALTCKEQSLVFPFALLIFASAYAAFHKEAWRKTVPQFAAVIVLCVVSVAFIAMRREAMSIMTGPYRCGLDWAQIVPNLIIGVLWLFRFFPFGTPAWDGIPRDLWASHDSRLYTALSHDLFRWHGMWNPLAAIVGVVIFALFVYAIVSIYRKDERREKWMLSGLLFSLPVFMALPVYSGGRPWHFALPAIVVMIVSAMGLERFLGRIGKEKWMAGVSIFAGCVLVLASVHDFGKSRITRYSMNMVNLAALKYPPRSAESIAPNAKIYYVTGHDFWAFGNGHLFEWVYLRPDVKDMSLHSPDELTMDDLKGIAEGRDYYFYYDWNRQFWKDKTAAVTKYYNDMQKNGVTIAFGNGGNADDYVGQGWYAGEREGRWTKASRAVLKLPGMAPSGKKLLIWTHAYTPTSHPDQSMKVYCNGATLGEVRISRDGSHPSSFSFDLPKDAIRSDSQEIVFEIADPASPKEFDNSADDRELGFFLKELELIPEPAKDIFH